MRTNLDVDGKRTDATDRIISALTQRARKNVDVDGKRHDENRDHDVGDRQRRDEVVRDARGYLPTMK